MVRERQAHALSMKSEFIYFALCFCIRKNKFKKVRRNRNLNHSVVLSNTNINDSFISGTDKLQSLGHKLNKIISKQDNQTFDAQTKRSSGSNMIGFPKFSESFSTFDSQYNIGSHRQNHMNRNRGSRLYTNILSPNSKFPRIKEKSAKDQFFTSISPVGTVAALNPLSDSSFLNID